MLLWLLIAALGAADSPLQPGDHTRSLEVDGRQRSYLLHIPPQAGGKTPLPVVLAFHGAAMNGPLMSVFSGLNKKADAAGFVAVYPNGTGTLGLFLTWNAAWADAPERPDDVAFTRKLLDDLERVVRVDRKRVYATGFSNGGMLCYRLAAELSERIAAIAPVSGAMPFDQVRPRRPVPVMHFHGTADKIVPLGGLALQPKIIGFKSVEESIQAWVRIDGCPSRPAVVDLPSPADDGTAVQRKTYAPGKAQSEVVLFLIQGGGHTWPGQTPPATFLGKSTKNISANDLIWEFFQRHPLP